MHLVQGQHQQKALGQSGCIAQNADPFRLAGDPIGRNLCRSGRPHGGAPSRSKAADRLGACRRQRRCRRSAIAIGTRITESPGAKTYSLNRCCSMPPRRIRRGMMAGCAIRHSIRGCASVNPSPMLQAVKSCGKRPCRSASIKERPRNEAKHSPASSTCNTSFNNVSVVKRTSADTSNAKPPIVRTRHFFDKALQQNLDYVRRIFRLKF